ncbi:MAG: methylated-DNA--[protein]-cysteine S-methyltransferase [Planctomycetota bacterium]|jgi:methylated-DNA-[protein]-cysteine S-methyltransferase
MTADTTCRRMLDSPLGRLTVTVSADGHVSISWDRALAPTRGDEGLPAARRAEAVVALLARYFAGETVDFADVPVPTGSDFHRRCWAACRRIPRGETRSYGELAAMAGSPGAARAAGQAMRHNPLPLIVPCHRVIAADGRLHGFSGQTDPGCDDLARKRFLLDLEADDAGHSDAMSAPAASAFTGR